MSNYNTETLTFFKGLLIEQKVKTLAQRQRNGDPIFIEQLKSSENKPQVLEKHFEEEKILKRSLSDIDEALKRIANGNYGICEDCGKPILLERLRIMPVAKRCTLCQGKKKIKTSSL